MTHTVLFVCSMNVCRSPLMQWAFIDGLPKADAEEFEVTSRGLDAGRGNAICAEGAKLMQGSNVDRQFARPHSSAPLTTSDLSQPGLVIVATRAERATLARYAPALRSLTFTLREANLLAAGPVASSELAEIARDEQRLEAELPLYGMPALLHRRRGTISIPRSHGWGRRQVDPLDVPDLHLGRPSAHRAMLRSVKAETSDLVSRFNAFSEQRRAI